MAKSKKSAKSILDRARESQMKANAAQRETVHTPEANLTVGEPFVEEGNHPTDPRQPGQS